MNNALDPRINELSVAHPSLPLSRSFVKPYCKRRYSDKLDPIKAKYPEFAQKMSPRFYDSARFFSDEMLFGR